MPKYFLAHLENRCFRQTRENHIEYHFTRTALGEHICPYLSMCKQNSPNLYIGPRWTRKKKTLAILLTSFFIRSPLNEKRQSPHMVKFFSLCFPSGRHGFIFIKAKPLSLDILRIYDGGPFTSAFKATLYFWWAKLLRTATSSFHLVSCYKFQIFLLLNFFPLFGFIFRPPINYVSLFYF